MYSTQALGLASILSPSPSHPTGLPRSPARPPYYRITGTMSREAGYYQSDCNLNSRNGSHLTGIVYDGDLLMFHKAMQDD